MSAYHDRVCVAEHLLIVKPQTRNRYLLVFIVEFVFAKFVFESLFLSTLYW